MKIQKSNELTIDDLNKYLPALRKLMTLNLKTIEQMKMFLWLSSNGLENPKATLISQSLNRQIFPLWKQQVRKKFNYQ